MRQFLMSLLLLITTTLLFANEKEYIDVADAKVYMMAATISPEPVPQGGGIMGDKKIRIINLGPIVNHEDYDYAPTVSADGKTLYYVSNRDGSILTVDDDPSHDFWYVKKENYKDTIFSDPINLDPNPEGDMRVTGVNTITNEGAASIAADRQSLYFTACNREDGQGSCDIYKTTIVGDKWQKPFNLGKQVNSKNFDSQPSISASQDRVYFISTREGPNSDGEDLPENFDIWYSDYDFDLEEWGKAKNLTSINTKGREVSPFIGADGVTLFFASDGHEPNYGGLDFYVSRFDPATDTWSAPENIGEPINTDQDEQFISLPATGDIIYFSSTRDDLDGYQGSLDVFMAFVPTFFQAVQLTGTVKDECSGEVIDAMVTIKNPLTGKEITKQVNADEPKFDMIISNDAYGDPANPSDYVDFEITATNEQYGTTTIIQRVERPEVTNNSDEADKVALNYDVVLTLGQQPVLSAIIEEGDYLKENRASIPELKDFNGLVMKEVVTYDLYPLLNYVFFEKGSSELKDDYVLFDGSTKAFQDAFTDTTIAGGTMDKYYNILNIIGFRLNENPTQKIKVIGCNDNTTEEEKGNLELSKARATLVYNYLRDQWGISEDRMELKFQNFPDSKAKPTDEEHHQENRRVEIVSTSKKLNDYWPILKPVFEVQKKLYPQPESMEWIITNGISDAIVASKRIEITRAGQPWATISGLGVNDASYKWDWKNSEGSLPGANDTDSYEATLYVTTKEGAECKSEPVTVPVYYASSSDRRIALGAAKTDETYSLVLFPFNSYAAGPLNEKIMKDYVYGRVFKSSDVQVIGHTDITGMDKANKKLSINRAGTVTKGIRAKTKKYNSLKSDGVGEEDPLYTNATAEGRMYNRTVQVKIQTPLTEFDK